MRHIIKMKIYPGTARAVKSNYRNLKSGYLRTRARLFGSVNVGDRMDEGGAQVYPSTLSDVKSMVCNSGIPLVKQSRCCVPSVHISADSPALGLYCLFAGPTADLTLLRLLFGV